MYAVVATGGKQVAVTPGEVVKIEKLDKCVGETVEFTDVLMVRGRHKFILGSPNVESSKVIAEVTAQGKDKKVVIYKKKRRKGYQRKNGHRQTFTTVMIKEIVVPDSE